MKQILKNYHQYVVLPPNGAPRGNLFSIAMYIISSIFRLLTVTHGQGSMCIKNDALFMNKHHPTVKSFLDLIRCTYNPKTQLYKCVKSECVCLNRVDKGSLNKHPYLSIFGRPTEYLQCLLNEIFQEDYIIKEVDLLSGFGGAMGLWLGWSVMTLGDLFVTLVKTFKAITSADK